MPNNRIRFKPHKLATLGPRRLRTRLTAARTFLFEFLRELGFQIFHTIVSEDHSAQPRGDPHLLSKGGRGKAESPERSGGKLPSRFDARSAHYQTVLQVD